ncbi:MAG: amidohydrolase family protein [Kofleriaceae bacterium]
MSDFDTIIYNGYLVDGTGSPGHYADVGIRAGRVAEIGNLEGRSAQARLDAAGKIVAPGHVTSHAHYDVALFWDPYCSNSGEHGVTTLVNANCGFGIAPVRRADRERTMAMLETTEQIPVAEQRAVLPWSWETFPEYLECVRALRKGVNVLSYLPINPLLVYVMGVEAAKTRRPTRTELAELVRLIHEAMDAGAIGISMSVMGAEGNSHVDSDGSPMPTDSMDRDVMVELGRAVAARREGVIQLVSQIVSYGDRAITERMAEMARGSGARVVHNTFLTTDATPELAAADLAWLDGLRQRGLDVTAASQLSRGWIEAGIHQLDVAAGQLPAVRRIIACKSPAEVLELISSAELRRAFAAQYAEAGPTNGAAGMEGQTVIAVGDDPALAPLVGKTLGELARASGRGVIDVLLDLGVRSGLALQLKSPPINSTSPDHVARMLAQPGVIAGGSDGGAHTKAFGMGHYATDLLVWVVRDERKVSLEEMHFQLSLKPARSLGIADRGALLPGFWADVLIYDLAELHVDTTRYEIVHDMPNGDWRRKARAGGYDRVLVNGVITHERDRPTGAVPGQLVRTTRDLGGGGRARAADAS